MVARDPRAAHRPATTLELLYDLVFVVAIAMAAAGLHHAIAEAHATQGVIGFVLVFFAIWWAWMNFTWFASAFDTDDGLYRVKVLLQMFGVLILAAGVERAFEHQDYLLVTIGYTVMRVGLIAQWLRAARVPGYRATALRYAVGLGLVQLGWLALLLLPADQWIYGWFLVAPAELLVPVIAEKARPTPWHAEHIAERYGLLTIIVIGESVLAATIAVKSALDQDTHLSVLSGSILGAPLIFFSMWWLYFARPHHTRLSSPRSAFVWGYAHFFIYATAAAVGAGLAVAVDFATHHAEISSFAAGQAVALPVAIFLLVLRLIHPRHETKAVLVNLAFGVTAAACLLVPFLTPTPLAFGILLAALTAVYSLTGPSDNEKRPTSHA